MSYVPRTTFCGVSTSWASIAKRPTNPNHGHVGYREDAQVIEVYDAITKAWVAIGNVVTTLTSDLTLGSGADLIFSGTTGQNLIKPLTNLADALSLKDSAGVAFLTVVTTTATPSLQVKQNMAMAVGKFFDKGYATFAAGLTGGKTALTSQVCYVTAADATHVFVTLPPPAAGRFILVCNNSGQTIQVFPNASETINNTTSANIATYKAATFISDGTNWISAAGA